MNHRLVWLFAALLAGPARAGEDAPANGVPPVEARKTRFAVADRDWPAEVGDASVCLWKDDKFAAFTATIDDNWVSEHEWWFAKADEVGFRITWFVITGKVRADGRGADRWDVWKKVLERGHDVGSHTVSHLGDDGLTIEQEYAESIKAIEDHLPGHRVRALAYPGGPQAARNAPAAAARHYAAARGVGGTMNAANAVNYRNTNSVSGHLTLDEPHPSRPERKHWNNLRYLLEKGVGGDAYWRGWYCAHFHGKGDTARLDKGFAFLKENRDALWMGAFADVARYGQERDTATLAVKEKGEDRIALSLADALRDDWFDVPLTVKVRVPDAWKGVAARQGDRDAPVRRVEHDGKAYALVDVVPDRGDAVLTPAP